VRIPQNKVNQLRKILDAANRLTMSLGREASLEEVIEILQKSEDPDLKTLNSNVISDVMGADKKPTSLDAHFDSDAPGDSGTLHDILASPDHRTDDFMDLEGMKSVVSRLVSTLAPLPKEIVLRRDVHNNRI
jgi:DNA-directed RNA polymerase sigma subunit (sigma70/sigma32)